MGADQVYDMIGLVLRERLGRVEHSLTDHEVALRNEFQERFDSLQQCFEGMRLGGTVNPCAITHQRARVVRCGTFGGSNKFPQLGEQLSDGLIVRHHHRLQELLGVEVHVVVLLL